MPIYAYGYRHSIEFSNVVCIHARLASETKNIMYAVQTTDIQLRIIFLYPVFELLVAFMIVFHTVLFPNV